MELCISDAQISLPLRQSFLENTVDSHKWFTVILQNLTPHRNPIIDYTNEHSIIWYGTLQDIGLGIHVIFFILPWSFWFIPFWLGVKNSHGACTGIKNTWYGKMRLSSPTLLHSAISIYRRRLEHALRFDTLKLKLTFTMKRLLHLTYDGPRQWTKTTKNTQSRLYGTQHKF